MIALHRVTFAYSGSAVLDEFSLTLPDRGITGLTGPSGCGKTTLLHLLGGLLRPQSGKISAPPPEQTALLFQENRLFPWRTLSQHITDVLPPQRRDEAGFWLRFAELEQAAGAYPHTLSGGMARRAALCRALALGGELYLFDEPFAGIDEPRAARLFSRLRSLDTPTILISHAQEVLAMCDTVVQVDGPPLSSRNSVLPQ